MNDAFLVLGIAFLIILFIAAIIVSLILLIRKKGRKEEELPLSHKKEELKRVYKIRRNKNEGSIRALSWIGE